MFPRFDGTAAPRASGELVGSANAAPDELIATSLLDRFDGIIGAVGGRAASDPQADAKRRLSPTIVAVFQRLATNRLAGTNERCGPLDVLNREPSKRVPHQHGYAIAAIPSRHGALQAPQT